MFLHSTHHTQEIAPSVTAKFDSLDPTPPNAIYCPPGYFSANTTGPCEVCGLGFWCPGGYQSTPRRVEVKKMPKITRMEMRWKLLCARTPEKAVRTGCVDLESDTPDGLFDFTFL